MESKKNTSAMLAFNSPGVPTLYLVETEEYKRLSFINSNNGLAHSVIDFFAPNLKDYYDWLKEKGIEVGPLNVICETGFGVFSFKDPDGNLLSACNILHRDQEHS